MLFQAFKNFYIIRKNEYLSDSWRRIQIWFGLKVAGNLFVQVELIVEYCSYCSETRNHGVPGYSVLTQGIQGCSKNTG